MRCRSVLAVAAVGAIASAASAQSTITTMFTGGNGLGTGAINYFDITVAQAITIQSLEVNLSSAAGTACTIDVFVTAAGQGYAANTANAGAWTLVGSGPATAAGNNLPTSCDVADFTLQPGSYGMGIRYTGAGMNYTNGNGSNQSFSDAVVSLSLGASQATPWSSAPFTPRVWNGSITYVIANPTATGACCTPTAGCSFGQASACTAPNVFTGQGTSCTPNVCPHRGSCCSGTTNACTLSNNGAAGCTAGTTYQGDGTTCNPNICPQGACCDAVTGACTLTAPTGCTAGTFQTVGSACTPNPCPQEACCNPTTGACAIAATGACASGTTGQGTGTVCTPNPCPQPPPPANDNCADVVAANAPVIPGAGGQVTGNNSAATDDGAASCTAGHKDVYFLFTPTGNSGWTFATCATAPSFDTMISVHTGCPADTTTQVSGGCNDDSCGLLSSLTIPSGTLTAGTQYVVRVGNFSTTTTVGGVFVLDVTPTVTGSCCNSSSGACTISNTGAGGCAAGTVYQGDGSSCTPSPCPQEACCNPTTGACVLAAVGACASGTTGQGTGTVCTPNPCPQPPPPSNDECASALSITVGTTVSGTNVNATNSGAGVVATNLGSCTQTTLATGTHLDVWYSFVAPATTAYTIDTCGSGFDTILSIHSGCPADMTNILDCNDDSTAPAGNVACSNSGLNSRIQSVTLTAGQTYYIGVAGYNGGSGAFNLLVNFVNPPAGVCCRGSTCSTTVASSAACTGSLIGGQTAGASFPSAAGCNNTGVTTTPCCYADYNKTSGITVQDIFDFLNDWFAGSPYANFGGTGAAGPLAVQNIFDYLNAWFAGGC